jgi:N utilization substance protein B
MEKRSAAREIAFLALFQLPKNPEKLAQTDLQAICLSALRTLADYSKDNLKKAEAFFIKVERSLLEYQVDHEDNEGLNEATRAVALPKTDEFFEHLNNCYKSISMMREALQIPELYWHYHSKDTEAFSTEIIHSYIENQEEIKKIIAEASESWDISRMRKADRIILELATCEILCTSTVHSVVVSEAIKLANKYSTPEGVKFINGILADIIKNTIDLS